MRHAVVTGTSSGIGAAIVRRLLDDDWCVTGLDMAPPTIEADRFRAHIVDLAHAEQRRTVLDVIESTEALVHAAGLMRVGKLGALDDAISNLLWRVHVETAMALADRFATGMPRGGRIVLIGSYAARGVPGRSQYAASKAALHALARSWAAELIERGITVNVVSPATTDTPMLRDPARASVPPVMPAIGRYVSPEEVAALVAFLLSDAAAAITGQDILICGGASLRSQ